MDKTSERVAFFNEILLSAKLEVDDFEDSLNEQMPDIYFESFEIDGQCLRQQKSVWSMKNILQNSFKSY